MKWLRLLLKSKNGLTTLPKEEKLSLIQKLLAKDPEYLSLGEKQRLFSYLIAQHMLWLWEEGYEVTTGDFFRDPRVFGEVGAKVSYSAAFSMHKSRCAGDLNLFKDEEYLTKTSDHLESGEVWEARHPLCCWGGRFNDGNHYSITHEGRK